MNDVLEDLLHSLRALRQNLIVVLRGFPHHLPYLLDEAITHLLVEQVAHGVNEHLAGLFPAIGDFERLLILDDLAIPDHALVLLAGQTGVLGHAHGLQASGHLHRIAVLAACADD